jgi:hypothetical protein
MVSIWGSWYLQCTNPGVPARSETTVRGAKSLPLDALAVQGFTDCVEVLEQHEIAFNSTLVRESLQNGEATQTQASGSSRPSGPKGSTQVLNHHQVTAQAVYL